MNNINISYLRQLESESIHVIREVAAEFKNPVMVRLAQKTFYPGKIPFPLMHIDTGYKFPEMIEFRDWFTKEIGPRLIVERNEEWIGNGVHPLKIGVENAVRS